MARELLGGKLDFPIADGGQIDDVIKGRLEHLNLWSGLYLPGASQEDGRSGDLTDSSRVSKSERYSSHEGEQAGEQSMGTGKSSPVQVSINKVDGRDFVTADHYLQESEKLGEQNYKAWGEQTVRSTQWLKSILPEASNGWWDIRDKGDRIAIKFRWRDPNLQVLTPLFSFF